jgi:long-subunit acyl-CoA synthetase (AMP-forming)
LHVHASSLPALDDGVQCLSYGQLAESVAAEQRWLSAANIDRCGLLAENSAAWAIADMALMSAGALHVPLPSYFTAQQRQHALDDAGIGFVLTDQPERVEREHPEFLRVSRSMQTGLILMHRQLRSIAPVLPRGTVKITYTSGSTGTPKGVCLTSHSMLSVARSLAAATSELNLSRHLCLLPLATLLENIAGIYAPMLLGAQVVTPTAASLGIGYGGIDAPKFLQAIQDAAPDSLVLVPELLRLLVHACANGWKVPRTLRFIAVGGAAVSAELLIQAHRCGLPVYEGYGLSECASVVCLNTPGACRPGSVGKPLPHTRVRIDANGEICVGGAAVSPYLGDRRHSMHEIRTGDLGEMDADGFVYVRGRAKNLFITSMGRNVAPEWVERELTCEPQIAQAMVVGEARPFPVALIAAADKVPRAGVDRAIARANSRLPDYARVRHWISFPEAPSHANGLMTANGRLRRRAVLDRYGALVAPLYDSEEKFADVLP